MKRHSCHHILYCAAAETCLTAGAGWDDDPNQRQNARYHKYFVRDGVKYLDAIHYELHLNFGRNGDTADDKRKLENAKRSVEY